MPKHHHHSTTSQTVESSSPAHHTLSNTTTFGLVAISNLALISGLIYVFLKRKTNTVCKIIWRCLLVLFILIIILVSYTLYLPDNASPFALNTILHYFVWLAKVLLYVIVFIFTIYVFRRRRTSKLYKNLFFVMLSLIFLGICYRIYLFVMGHQSTFENIAIGCLAIYWVLYWIYGIFTNKPSRRPDSIVIIKDGDESRIYDERRT